jgi:hypothetical protein
MCARATTRCGVFGRQLRRWSQPAMVNNASQMVKGLLRFALIWGISMLLTPYLNRLFDRLAQQAPRGSFLEDALLELSDRYSSTLIRSFGETVGELVLGPK